MDNDSKKEIEIVAGNGSELSISAVSEHITALKPKTKSENDKNNKKIVIPKVNNSSK